MLLASARVALVAARGLSQQLTAMAESPKPPAALSTLRRLKEEVSTTLPFMELPFFNGLGGFTSDGKEYAIYLGPRLTNTGAMGERFRELEFWRHGV